MSTLAPAARPRRAAVWLLGVLFLLPLGGAFLLYYGSSWRPMGRTNHGELIEPAQPLPLLSLPEVQSSDSGVDDGARAPASPPDLLRGKWSLLYVGGGECDARCRDALYLMRQTHYGLGHLFTRVQRVFLITGGCCDRAWLAREQPDLIALRADAPAAAALLAPFPEAQRPGSIFIVDPRGNLMMRYGAGADPKGLREDLKKLLALSHIG